MHVSSYFAPPVCPFCLSRYSDSLLRFVQLSSVQPARCVQDFHVSPYSCLHMYVHTSRVGHGSMDVCVNMQIHLCGRMPRTCPWHDPAP